MLDEWRDEVVLVVNPSSGTVFIVAISGNDLNMFQQLHFDLTFSKLLSCFGGCPDLMV